MKKKPEQSSSIQCYLEEIKKIPALSEEEQETLLIKMSNGDEKARNRLVEGCLRLVVCVAKKYIGKGLSFQELISVGNLELIEATRKYNIENKIKFTTYVFNLIEFAMKNAIKRNTRPVNDFTYKKYKSYEEKIKILKKKLNRIPTLDEIALETNLTIAQINELQRLQISLLPTISLNATLDDDECETEPVEYIPNPCSNPEEIVTFNFMKAEIQELLEICNLSEKEQEALMLRYGFYRGKQITFAEIGNSLGITSQAAQQLINKALMKLRASEYIKGMAVYMDYPEQAFENIRKYMNTKKISSSIKKKIYEYFPGYESEIINEILLELSEYEKKLIEKIYGPDLNNPIEAEINNQDKAQFRLLRQRIKNKLKKI